MPNKSFKVCSKIGCPNITQEKYCPTCAETEPKKQQRLYDQQRGTAHQRGYTKKWDKGRIPFFNCPENQFCYIKGPNCLGIANVKEHIIPPEGPDDPLFNDESNFGAACVPCNSWKNHRSIQQLVENEAMYYNNTKYNPIEELKLRKQTKDV
jgi:5-methylcytosine-specific restriction protein A